MFSSFDAFCRAFWKAVADDAFLSGQFTQLRQMDMKRGLAPVSNYYSKAPIHPKTSTMQL
ncbi:hypothetical protein [Pseudomonas sp. PP3]|uniref:hypothetical protein n=1 Tax=Pseudomonas sp. PP3 TaxID=2815936 RepID=UPI0032AF17D3